MTARSGQRSGRPSIAGPSAPRRRVVAVGGRGAMLAPSPGAPSWPAPCRRRRRRPVVEPGRAIVAGVADRAASVAPVTVAHADRTAARSRSSTRPSRLGAGELAQVRQPIAFLDAPRSDAQRRVRDRADEDREEELREAVRRDRQSRDAVAAGRIRPASARRRPRRTPSPPGVIGTAASRLARPNETIRASMSRLRRTHGGTPTATRASTSQFADAQNTTRLSSCPVADELLEPLADLAERRGDPIRVDPQLAGDPAHDAFGAALALHDADHQERRDADHDDADERRAAVVRVDAADAAPTRSARARRRR